MIEYPVFVPVERDHLAAVVTIPDGEPRGLVMLLPGANAPRTHKYRLWSRAARSLAARGIASTRVDYRGIGDSTGVYSLAMDVPPVEEITTVAGILLERLGVGALGLVGNCLGARTAFGVAARFDLPVSVAAIVPVSLGPVVQHPSNPTTRLVRGVAGGLTPVRRAIRRTLRLGGLAAGPRFIPEVEAALRSGHVMFLHGGSTESHARLARAANALGGRVGDGATDRLQIWSMPSEGFRPIENQGLVVDAIVRWMDTTLPSAPDVITLPEIEEALPA